MEAAEEQLNRAPGPAQQQEQEPLLPAGGAAEGVKGVQRKDSEPDMLQRLSHDAQPANMLHRLSGAWAVGQLGWLAGRQAGCPEGSAAVTAAVCTKHCQAC
jgi:hypothetical protein